MKKIIVSAAMLAVCTLVFSGCNQDSISKEVDIQSSEAIVGTSKYIAQLTKLAPTLTKADELSEDEAKSLIEPVLIYSISYLEENGYDYTEDFDSPDDPKITWVALGLAEYDKLYLHTTKTTVGGCVLQAVGLDALLNGGAAKSIAKKVAKKSIGKVVPYVGEVLIAIDFVACIIE